MPVPIEINELTVTAKEEFQQQLRAGRAAFEGGNYRQSIVHFEAAYECLGCRSRQGGEAGVWLISAYQAAGRSSEAIALCQELEQHPFIETRRQSQRLRYILEAPVLKRPEEWTVKIPDLANLPESDPKDRRGSQSYSPAKAEEPLDPSEIVTEDNAFTWVALGAVVLLLGSLLVLG